MECQKGDNWVVLQVPWLAAPTVLTMMHLEKEVGMVVVLIVGTCKRLYLSMLRVVKVGGKDMQLKGGR